MIVQTGPMLRHVVAAGFTLPQAALDRLGDGEALRHRERNGGVDADAARGRRFDGLDAGARGRDLDDHVWRQRVEALRPVRRSPRRSDRDAGRSGSTAGRCVRWCAANAGISSAAASIDNCSTAAHADLVFGGRRLARDQRCDARTPFGDPRLQHGVRDHRVARRADAALIDAPAQIVEDRRNRSTGTWPSSASSHAADSSTRRRSSCAGIIDSQPARSRAPARAGSRGFACALAFGVP